VKGLVLMLVTTSTLTAGTTKKGRKNFSVFGELT